MGFYTFFREVEYRSGFNSTFRYSESPFHYPQAFVLCHYFLRCRFRIGHIPFHAVPFFVFLYLVFVYTVFADVGVALLAVLNSVRILSKKFE